MYNVPSVTRKIYVVMEEKKIEREREDKMDEIVTELEMILQIISFLLAKL